MRVYTVLATDYHGDTEWLGVYQTEEEANEIADRYSGDCMGMKIWVTDFPEINNKTVTTKNCPFPEGCSEYGMCEKEHCEANVCSNGYAYRMS